MRKPNHPAVAAALCLGAMAQWPAAAQFQDLATNGNGSVLYFASPVRPKDTDQSFHSKIFRWDESGGIRIFAEVRPEGEPGSCDSAPFYQRHSPQVSDDGSVVAYTGTRPAPGARTCAPIEINQGTVRLPAGELQLDGSLALSRNGRYAVTTPVAFAGLHVLTDLNSAVSTLLSGAFYPSAQSVTDDGAIATSEASAVVVTDRNGGTRALATKYEVDGVIIDRSGQTIVYVTYLAPGLGGSVQPGRLSSIDLKTGRETQLTIGLVLANPILSNDGTTVFFTDYDSTGQSRQLYAIRLANNVRRQITSLDDQIEAAAVSGDGLTAFAITGGERLVRIDVASGIAAELSPSPPFVSAAYRGFEATTIAAAGSAMSLIGAGLGSTRRLTFCGQPVAFQIARNPGLLQLQFQVPQDAVEGECEVIVQNDSPFEHGINLEVRKFDPLFVSSAQAFYHQGSAGPVTSIAPARPGEVIAAYLTGLGPLDSSGQILQPGFTCTFDGVAGTVVYAGLAPGFPGFYQLNVTVPDLSPRAAAVSCGWDGRLAFTTVWIGSL